MSTGRVRQSIAWIQNEYENGNHSMLENLIRAFRGIQALPPDNENSFFYLASLHGMPFNKPGDKAHTNDNEWWGGYCWHDTILFPTWHRIYLLKFEDALRSIPGCEDVTLPYWDELANVKNATGGILPGFPGEKKPVIPEILTSPTFDLDGRIVENPLFSYRLQKALVQKENNHRYSKPEGYNTVRYPYSGLVGTESDKKNSVERNAKISAAQAISLLNDNVTEWLNGTVVIPDIPGETDYKKTPRPDTYSVFSQYIICLSAPNYTVFSNKSSQNQWIKDHDKGYQKGKPSHYVVSLESPHNAIHLAVGGFYQKGKYNASPIPGANGDMGDNETAGFDPIFFLHHCFIDYTFSIWQQIHGFTKRGSLDIIEDKITDDKGHSAPYPGTVLKVGQPLVLKDTLINMNTPLYPFKKADGTDYTSIDATDISELGYSYDKLGSLERMVSKDDKMSANIFNPVFSIAGGPMNFIGYDPTVPSPFSAIKRVYNIRRSQYPSSFIIRLYARNPDGKEVEVGREAILSRSYLKGCANCQNHLDVEMIVPIDPAALLSLQPHADANISQADVVIDWAVKIQTSDGRIREPVKKRSGADRTCFPQVVDL